MKFQEILEGITRHRADKWKTEVPMNESVIPDLTRKLDEIEWALQALAEKLAEKGE